MVLSKNKERMVESLRRLRIGSSFVRGHTTDTPVRFRYLVYDDLHCLARDSQILEDVRDPRDNLSRGLVG